jgi:hypothetical protein
MTELKTEENKTKDKDLGWKAWVISFLFVYGPIWSNIAGSLGYLEPSVFLSNILFVTKVYYTVGFILLGIYALFLGLLTIYQPDELKDVIGKLVTKRSKPLTFSNMIFYATIIACIVFLTDTVLLTLMLLAGATGLAVKILNNSIYDAREGNDNKTS